MWSRPENFKKQGKFSVSKNYKLYTSFDSVADIISLVKDDKNQYNELIFKDDRVKPYFDIESTTEFNIQDVIVTIKKVFYELSGKELLDDEIFILECNRVVKDKFKWSYHVIIDNYHFDNQQHAKYFARKIHDLHPDVVDMKVYSNGLQNIRMLNCVKQGEKEKFKLLGKQYSDEIFGKCLITNVSDDSIALEFEGLVVQDPSYSSCDSIETEELDFVIPLIEKDLGTCIMDVREGTDYWSFNYDHGFKCLFGNSHSQLGHFIKKIGQDFYVYCFSETCKGFKKKYTVNQMDNIDTFLDKVDRSDKKLLDELDIISSSSKVNTYDIKHLEILNKSKASIQALINGKALDTVHDCLSEKCEKMNLYSECKKGGYRICCKNCDFAFPQTSIPVDKAIAPQIFNILVMNKEEDISNKDTAPVAEKILTFINLIYTDDNKWYLFDEKTGIYENKKEATVFSLIKKVIETMVKDKETAEWHNWIRKIQYKKALLEELKIECFLDEELDTTKDLLGCNNGIIDLETVEFRKGTPEDLVSYSVGYDFIQKSDKRYNQKLKDEFLEFMSQIYPLKDELEIIQRYCGYCLKDDHPSKTFLLLTDKRQGFNAKSSICKMIRLGMGDYARKGGNSILYKSDLNNDNVNSHSAGMLSYSKIRVAAFEELDPKRTLANDVLKDLNGGNSTFEGRKIKSDKIEKFTWGTKFILCFNNDNFPNFDFGDTAFIQRILIVQHRSRFYKEESDYLKNKHKPYTFKAKDLDDKLKQWRPYYLEWALEGLRNYYKLKFDTVPESCKKWRENLVESQDTITPFIHGYIEEGTEEEFLSLIDLYDLYFSLNRETENNKRMSIGRKKFYKKAEEILDCEVFERKKINGICYRKIIYGYKIIVD